MPGEAALLFGRRAAESRMTSRALVRHPSGTTEGPDGFDVPAYTDTYADLPMRLAASRGATSSRTVTVGSTEVETATPVAHFPWNTVLADNDLFEVTAGERPGRFFRVVESTGADQQTALRVPVVEVQRPEGWA